MSGAQTGRLLVASPSLDDPNFARTVVLLLDHDDEGSLGVVLNRASSVPVDGPLAEWLPLAADPPVVFGGGPVEPTAVVAIGRATPGADDANWTPIVERVRLVDLDADPHDAAELLEGIRIFAGYAGWGPEQLQQEIDHGAWFVVDVDPADVLSPRPARLWRDVLRRQRGRLRLYANFPDDPSTN